MKDKFIPSEEVNIENVMGFIESQLLKEIKPREIKVYTSKENWDYLLLPSISKFLFEEINIIDNFAPLGQSNRPGNKYPKYYICVHDTGDYSLGAHQWSEIVKKAKNGDIKYTASFQYVVGNDGYYHNIPDDEEAHHAGDGHDERSLFGLVPTGVYINKSNKDKDNNSNNTRAKVEIDNEGYYTINGERAKVQAPRKNDEILTTNDINDLGIYYTLKEQGEDNYEYYLGRTWYSPVYKKISNYGGNLNSIGIEACINYGTDVYYTWQKVAKLVAKLRKENSLDMGAVVQHHYFSGKNCPQTTRTANLWEYFKDLVSVEYQMLQYQKQGYKFQFESEVKEYINEKGRVIKKVNSPTTVNYTITVTNNTGESLTKKFSSLLLP